MILQNLWRDFGTSPGRLGRREGALCRRKREPSLPLKVVIAAHHTEPNVMCINLGAIKPGIGTRELMCQRDGLENTRKNRRVFKILFKQRDQRKTTVKRYLGVSKNNRLYAPQGFVRNQYAVNRNFLTFLFLNLKDLDLHYNSNHAILNREQKCIG